jgi:hypothetical protein
MGRKKKNPEPQNLNPNPNPNPNPNEGADSVTNESDLIVEDHNIVQSAEPDSAWEKIKNAATRSGLFVDEDERVETRGRKKKTAASDEFATLIISVLVLILSFSNVPEEVKPNDAELRVLANHLSGLMLRHLPISSKFSQDSLDIIGIIAVVSGWYARVSPAIKELQSQKKETKTIQAHAESPAPARVEEKPLDPVERLSPATARFLDEVTQRNHDNKQ